MAEIDRMLEANEEWAQRFPGEQAGRARRRKVAVVACMDSRMPLFGLLGLEIGDAHVIRNAGGVITEDTIRSLTISQHVLGTREIVLVHHTDCGLQKSTDDVAFADLVEQATGRRPPWAGADVHRRRRRRPGVDPPDQGVPVPALRGGPRHRLRRGDGAAARGRLTAVLGPPPRGRGRRVTGWYRGRLARGPAGARACRSVSRAR